MGKHTLALCHLYFLFLQKANAGDPCAAHIIKDIGTAQVSLLLANDADRILAAEANPGVSLWILPVLSLASLRFHLLGALLVGISLTGGVAGAERDRKAADAVWTVLAFIGAAQQRVVIFRAVIDALERGVAAGKAPAEITFAIDQKAAWSFPCKLQ